MYDAVDFELHVQEPYFTQLKGGFYSLSCSCRYKYGMDNFFSVPNIKRPAIFVLPYVHGTQPRDPK
jgi:hypothetical protein